MRPSHILTLFHAVLACFLVMDCQGQRAALNLGKRIQDKFRRSRKTQSDDTESGKTTKEELYRRAIGHILVTHAIVAFLYALPVSSSGEAEEEAQHPPDGGEDLQLADGESSPTMKLSSFAVLLENSVIVSYSLTNI